MMVTSESWPVTKEAGDKVAEGAIAVAGPVRDAAHAADAAGVPYAGLGELIAGIVVSGASFYVGHRKGKASGDTAAKPAPPAS